MLVEEDELFVDEGFHEEASRKSSDIDDRSKWCEILFNLSLWTGFVFYSTWSFSQSSYEDFNNYDDHYHDFANGWSQLHRKQDKSDYEWNMILYIYKVTVPWFVVHLIGAHLIQLYRISNEVLKLWFVIWPFAYLWMKFNLTAILLLAAQPLLYQAVNRMLNTNHIVLWICNIVWIVTINLLKLQEPHRLLDLKEMESSIVLQMSFWISLRCLYFYTYKVKRETVKLPSKSHDDEKIAEDNGEYETDNFLDCMAYCFYMPTMITGPFLLYNDYKQVFRVDQRNLILKLFNLLVRLSRFVFWLLIVEYLLHYFYVNVYAYHPDKVAAMSSWSLYGYGYAMGQFFHMKYLIMYGISTTLARFDGCKVPELPKCIGRIHFYTDMWKYFDRGLYKFLLECIYVPTLYDRRSFRNVTASSGLCFAYIYLWHGLQPYILVWSTLNFLGVIVENFFTRFTWKWYARWNRKPLTPNRRRRMVSTFACPLLAVSAISNFYFFAGSDVGNVFFYRLFTDPIHKSGVLLFALYNCCQVSSAIQTWEKYKMI